MGKIMNKLEINTLKEEIDRLKEYINTDLCKKCEEMANRLQQCEKLLVEYGGVKESIE